MAKQIINIGANSNDKTGDTLRSGAVKINGNFTELYNSNQSVFNRLTAGQHITLTKTGDTCIITANVPPYVLQPANTATLGGVKVDGSTIMINSSGVIHAVIPTVTTITGNAGTVTNGVYTTGSYANPSWITEIAYSKLSGTPSTYYTLSAATSTVLGGVKVDGVTITIDGNGVIHSSPNITGNAGTVTNGVYTTESYVNPSWIESLPYSKITGTPMLYVLQPATDTTLGGVKVDGTTITIDIDGVIHSNSGSSYSLPTAGIGSDGTLGGVKVDGSTVTINVNGVISASAASYTLPVASTTKLGGVIADGTTITIDGSGVISSPGSIGVVTLSRATKTGTTTSIAAGATVNLTITGYKSYALYSVATSSTAGGAWVRIYTDAASRTADAARLQTSDPSTPGVIAEIITTSNSTVVTAPGVIGFNNESTPTANIELAVTNTNLTAATFTITLTVLPLES
jgi:hypothetical protein